MANVLGFLAEHGLMLLAGVTALLSAGAIAAAMQRSPIHRQRLGELSILCTLLWLALACIPLPRWLAAGPMRHRETIAHRQTVIELKGADLELLRQLQAAPANRAHDSGMILDPSAERSRESFRSASPSTSRAAPTTVPLTWQPLAAAAYLIGTGVCIGWLILGHALLWRMLRRAASPQRWLAELFGQAAAELGVRRARLRVFPRAVRPLSCGIIRPTVLLSSEIAIESNSQRLRQVLRHELVHLAHRDAWGNALFNAAMPLLYVHPAYWWLRSKTFLARELLADDRAAALTGRVTYAADLLALARSCRAPRLGPIAAVGMFQFTTDLSRRILMLVQHQRHQQLSTRCSAAWRTGWLTASGAALVIACGALGLRPAAAQDAKNASETRTADEPTTPENLIRTETATTAVEVSPERPASKTAIDVRTDNASRDEIAVLQKQLADTTDQLAKLQDQQQLLQQRLHDMGGNPDLTVSNQLMRESADRLNKVAHTTSGQLIRESAADSLNRLARTEPAHNNLDPRSHVLNELRSDVIDGGQTLDDGKGNLIRSDKRELVEHVDSGQLLADAAAHHAPADLRRGIDLIALANSYTDAIGQVRLARAKIEKYGPNGQAPESRAALQNAQTKYELLRHIAEAAFDQARQDLSRSEELYKTGAMPQADVIEAKTRVRILELILGTSNDTRGSAPSSSLDNHAAVP